MAPRVKGSSANCPKEPTDMVIPIAILGAFLAISLVGLPLNMRPDRFLDFEGTSLFCVNHGAYFQIEDGLCTKGPCRNKWLVPVAVSLMEDGRIVVD